MKQSEAGIKFRQLRPLTSEEFGILARLRTFDAPRRELIIDTVRFFSRRSPWSLAERKSQSASILRRAKRFGCRGEELLQLKEQLELHT
jgi:hypothetical protein